MKQQKILEEVDFMLTDEAKSDKRLNPIDLNVLAVLQFIGNDKAPSYNKDGWFILPLGINDKIKSTSLQKYLEDFEIKTTYRTIQRTINKLSMLDYIKYKKGFYNNETHSGMLPEIKILKGAISDYHEIVENTSNDSISDIYDKISYNTKITDCDTERYSDIVITTDTYTYTESNTNSNTNSKTKSKTEIYKDVFEFFKARTLGESFDLFRMQNPSIYGLGLPMDELREAYKAYKFEYSNPN